jgi:hypothetical protein
MTQSRGRLWNHEVIRTLPGKIRKGGIVHPLALTPAILVTQPRFTGCRLFVPRFSGPVKAIWLWITSIIKPVSSKLYMSSSRMPYLAFVLATSSNQDVITRGSSLRACWRSYGRLLRSLISGVRALRLSTQCLPTGFPPRSASRSLAISRTIVFVAGVPRRSSSSIRRTSASSSSLLSFFDLGS